jgi:hypothetical protein
MLESTFRSNSELLGMLAFGGLSDHYTTRYRTVKRKRVETANNIPWMPSSSPLGFNLGTAAPVSRAERWRG